MTRRSAPRRKDRRIFRRTSRTPNVNLAMRGGIRL